MYRRKGETMASLNSKNVNFERVCLRKRGRLKGEGCRSQFRTDVKMVSELLGDGFVWIPESTDGSASSVQVSLGSDHDPHFCYTPPIAFVTFFGDLSRLHRAMSCNDGEIDQDICQGRWIVKASTEGASKSQHNKKNEWKQVTTSHKTFFKEDTLAGNEGANENRSAIRISSLNNTAQQSSLSEDSKQPVANIIAVNLTKPQNLGSIYRLMACYGCKIINHVYRTSAAPPRWNDEHRMQSIKSLSRGCDVHASRRLISTGDFVAKLKASRDELLDYDGGIGRCPAPKRAKMDVEANCHDLLEFNLPADRPPIVAIETATGAVDITSFKFPRDCFIMVGSEGSGIDPKILRAMAPGYDKLVYIPMHGPHHSLNVAMALNVALYEWRRQHPAPVSRNDN